MFHVNYLEHSSCASALNTFSYEWCWLMWYGDVCLLVQLRWDLHSSRRYRVSYLIQSIIQIANGIACGVLGLCVLSSGEMNSMCEFRRNKINDICTRCCPWTLSAGVYLLEFSLNYWWSFIIITSLWGSGSGIVVTTHVYMEHGGIITYYY